MLNRGTKSTVACVELCSAADGVRAAGVSGRAFQLSTAPGVRRGVGDTRRAWCVGEGAAVTWCQVNASVRRFWHKASTEVARGELVPVCAKIFLGNLARAAAVSYAKTLSLAEGYWHKTQHSTPREKRGKVATGAWEWAWEDVSA